MCKWNSLGSVRVSRAGVGWSAFSTSMRFACRIVMIRKIKLAIMMMKTILKVIITATLTVIMKIIVNLMIIIAKL